MTDAEINIAVLQIFRAPADQQFQKLQTLLASLQTEHEKNYFHSAFDVLKNASNNICLVLIHGIRTHATWQDLVKQQLRLQKNVQVVPIGYGFLDVIRFLFPFWTRTKPIQRVTRELRDLTSVHHGDQIVVIAHSFGTFIISKILRDEPDIRINRLLLCGSIIPDDYRWDTLPRPPARGTVVNEVGTNDVWPVLARVGSWGYGPSGSFGFKTSRVTDRFFKYGHSDFFTKKHIDGFWKPYILSGEINESPWDSKRPNPALHISILGGLPFIKLIILSIFAVLAFIIYQYLYS